MCHYCGAEPTKSKDEQWEPKNGNSLKLNGEGSIWSCRFCQEKLELESMKRDGLRSASPVISPTTSLSSSDRSVSSCSKFLPFFFVIHLTFIGVIKIAAYIAKLGSCDFFSYLNFQVIFQLM